ncbi:DNA sulfur modification protein DndD [Psychrobacillus sp. NPDC093200]|uniref:DNA sulfur modification protein DndD n=1 Tax=Psychrobacillus sp. NPDC093200 TaxID=3390656 RepID=UPI003CFF3BB1
MKFKKIIFDNYKTFYGTQTIDLYIPKNVVEEEGKNIILIGGLNGAGKTTILKAITDVLYGKRGITEAEYKKTFSNVINNTYYSEGGSTCAVSLFFEVDSGEEWNLKVKWYFDSNKTMTHDERELFIKSPGSTQKKYKKIENIEAYNRLIDKIMPFYASPFFIFDGEEVKEIILRQKSNEMKETIHKITGMNSYKQLVKDLYNVTLDIKSKISKAQRNSQIHSIKKDLDKLDQEINDINEKKNTLLEKIKTTESSITSLKDVRNKILTQNSQSRESIIKRQSSLEHQLNQEKNMLERTLNENIISIILKEDIEHLKIQLLKEQENRNNKLLRNASLKPYREFINELFKNKIEPSLSEDQINQINLIGEEIWVNQYKIKSTENETNEIHDISQKDLNTLRNYKTLDKSIIKNYINKIEKLEEEIEKIEVEFLNAPEFKDTKVESEKIDSLMQILGKHNTILSSYNNKLYKLKESRSNLLGKVTRSSEENYDINTLETQLKQTESVITVINQYIIQVTELKANFIKEEFSNMLLKLFRKQDEFGKIEFDINNYSVRLYNDKMQEINISDRSAGEMQMISSALIWALIKVSDLDLPVVIDTPLGRLDSYHRNQLINQYYTQLSHQVIILSTDTEITKDYIDIMKKYSYNQYMLDYKEDKKYTVISKGYFDLIGG